MRYISTRGNDTVATAAQAVCNGIARDGGLYVPEALPCFTEEDRKTIQGGRYTDAVSIVFRKLLSGYDKEDLDKCVLESYRSAFEGGRVAPMHRLDANASVLELWHGPTAAFKDVALQALPYLITCAQKHQAEGSHISILVATSGDTGKAALEAFRDVPGTSVTVLYPQDGVSQMQKLQMQTQRGKNVSVIAVEGNFDDAQTCAKAVFADKSFCARLKANGTILSSANSINWGRLLPQIVYYVYTAFQRAGVTDYVVPTGNFGNILACWYAKRMGAPIGTLVCASNRNDVLTEFLQSGEYDSNRRLYKTLSPSMDILVSSNLERLLFELLEHDGQRVNTWMRELKETGSYRITSDLLSSIQAEFCCCCCDDEQTVSEIKSVYEEYRYLIDPHTAVAMHAWREYRRIHPERNCVIVSTASPYKFPGAVYRAIAADPEEPANEFVAMEQLSALTHTRVPMPLKELYGLPRLHTDSCSQKDILSFAEERLTQLL